MKKTLLLANVVWLSAFTLSCNNKSLIQTSNIQKSLDIAKDTYNKDMQIIDGTHGRLDSISFKTPTKIDNKFQNIFGYHGDLVGDCSLYYTLESNDVMDGYKITYRLKIWVVSGESFSEEFIDLTIASSDKMNSIQSRLSSYLSAIATEKTIWKNIDFDLYNSYDKSLSSDKKNIIDNLDLTKIIGNKELYIDYFSHGEDAISQYLKVAFSVDTRATFWTSVYTLRK